MNTERAPLPASSSAYENVLWIAFVGDPEARLLVARDLAMEHGLKWSEVTDDEAEVDRVRSAVRQEISVFDGIRGWARCGGLRAIEPSQGGDLKGWMLANIARVWQRKSRLFEYQAKRGGPVRKKQRWETRDFVDLGGKHSPAHLSGFAPGLDGKTKTHGVSAPRRELPQMEPLLNTQLDFIGGRP